MRFYGIDDEQLMRMPINRFWLLSNNIDRISAQEDMRRARMMLLPNAKKEYIDDYFNYLSKEAGMVVEREPVLDREGLDKLKSLSKLKIL